MQGCVSRWNNALPPRRDVDFTNDIMHGSTPISKSPYRINGLFHQVRGKKVSSKIYLRSEYHQIIIKDKGNNKKNFQDKVWSLWVYGSTIFSYQCTSHIDVPYEIYFQWIHKQVFTCFYWLYIIYSKYKEEHAKHLKEVLQILREQQLYDRFTKCDFYQMQIYSLGHIISIEGISFDPKNFKVVVSWPTPKNVTNVRSFMGIASYYRRFIEGFSELSYLIT